MYIKTKKQNLTMQEAFNLYINEKKLNNYSESTINGKISHMGIFFTYVHPERLIKDISEDDIRFFIQSKINDNVKPISINSYLRCIRAFFNWAYNKQYMNTKLQFNLLRVQETNKKTFSDDNLFMLLKKPDLNKCNFSTYRDWVIINFILATGCRRGTIINILNEDIYIAEEYFEINKSKNKKSQLLPIATSLKPILIEYMSVRGGEPSDFLFCTVYGTKLNNSHLSHSIAKYCTSRGSDVKSIHALRHTFAKKAIIDCHMDVFRLKKMLNHSSIKTTEQYVAMYDEELLKHNNDFNPLNFVIKNKKEYIKIQ